MVDRHFYASEMLEPLTALAAAFRAKEWWALALSPGRGIPSGVATPRAVRGRAPGRHRVQVLNLAQQWLQTYLPWVLSKVETRLLRYLAPEELRARESRGRKLLAVLHRQGRASEASEYSQPEVAIGLTIPALRHEGMRATRSRRCCGSER